MNESFHTLQCMSHVAHVKKCVMLYIAVGNYEAEKERRREGERARARMGGGREKERESVRASEKARESV